MLDELLLERLGNVVEIGDAAIIYGSAVFNPLSSVQDIDYLSVSNNFADTRTRKVIAGKPVSEYLLRWATISSDACYVSLGSAQAGGFLGPIAWVRRSFDLERLVLQYRQLKLSRAKNWFPPDQQHALNPAQILTTAIYIEALFRPHFYPTVLHWRQQLHDGNTILCQWWDDMCSVAERLPLLEDAQSLDSLFMTEYRELIRFWHRFFETHEHSIAAAEELISKAQPIIQEVPNNFTKLFSEFHSEWINPT